MLYMSWRVFFFYPSDAHFNHIHFMFALQYTHTYRIRCDVIKFFDYRCTSDTPRFYCTILLQIDNHIIRFITNASFEKASNGEVKIQTWIQSQLCTQQGTSGALLLAYIATPSERSSNRLPIAIRGSSDGAMPTIEAIGNTRRHNFSAGEICLVSGSQV